MAPALTPLAEALGAILEQVGPPPGVIRSPLLEALGKVLAEDIVSTLNVPPCDNSAMDGYALRAADLDPTVNPSQSLEISQRIAAGDPVGVLAPGTAARIFTGAPVPAGADTVVMQENTRTEEATVIFTQSVELGRHIRPAGQDIAVGDRVLQRGRRLQPQDIGILASIGRVQVPVYRPLKVALMSTGDELVEPGSPLGSGQIYNSNRYTLSSLLLAMGCELVDGGIVADDAAGTAEQLRRLGSAADLVLSTGGVSVGEEDHVKSALQSRGELSLWKLNIKPGKPLAFGHIHINERRVPFIGLPGNPSSVYVTFALIARPFIVLSQGQSDATALQLEVAADFEWPRAGSRQEYLRARVEIEAGKRVVRLYPNQSSGVLLSTSWANALAIIPPGKTIARGEPVEVLLLSELR